MLNNKKTDIIFYTKKALKVTLVTIIISVIVLFYNSTIFLSQILFYKTMPYYEPNFNFSMLFDFNNREENNTITDTYVKDNIYPVSVNYQHDTTDSQDIISTFDPSQMEEGIIFNREIGILGLNDITGHPDYGFGPSVNVPFEMNITKQDIEELRSVNRMLNRFYSMDSNAGIIDGRFNIDNFLNADLSIEKDASKPQVLIFHTHAASEFFIDSNTDNLFDGIVGAGKELSRILTDKYGINVIHYPGVYDRVNGIIDRGGAYERIEPSIIRILEENPSIELVLDLHRDGVREDSNPDDFVTYIDGKRTARIMFVNGMSAINENGNVRHLTNLPNPYIYDNLAFSFNMQMAANEMFPGFTRRIYLKAFRYINHLRPHSSLVEVGTQFTTMEEAWNAMEPLADIIYSLMFAN